MYGQLGRRHILRQLRWYLLILALCAMALFLTGLLGRPRLSDAAPFFTQELQSVGENTDVGDADPEKLSLLYAKNLTRRAPLFSLPGTDPQALEEALVELEGVQNELASVQKSGAAQLVKAALYPTDFLRALAQAERARQKFLETGTQQDLKIYTIAQQRAFAAYLESLTRFRVAFEASVKPTVNKYATEKLIVSRKNSLDAIDELRESAGEVYTQLQERMRCIHGVVASCRPGELELPDLSKEDFSTEHSAVAQEIANLWREGHMPLEQRLVALSNSACVRASPAYFGVARTPDLASVVYVGDLRFLKPERADAPYYDFFAKKGVRYHPVTQFAHYKCFEMATDAGGVFATLATLSLSQKTLSSYATGEAHIEMRSLEAAFEKNAIRDSDARKYLGTASRLNLPEDLKNEVIETTLAFDQGSQDFDALLRQIAENEGLNIKLYRAGVEPDLSADYLFFIRSAFPSLFFAHNASISGSHAPLFEKVARELDEPFIYYSDFHADADMSAQLRRDFLLQRATQTQIAETQF